MFDLTRVLTGSYENFEKNQMYPQLTEPPSWQQLEAQRDLHTDKPTRTLSKQFKSRNINYAHSNSSLLFVRLST